MKHIRQKKILSLLADSEVMTIAELAIQMGTSKMTIRRDFEELEQGGIIKRIHGGAILLRQLDLLDPYEVIVQLDKEAKNIIGAAAAKLVQPGNIVCFDPGTTPLAVANHIDPATEFTAITVGLITAQALCRKGAANVLHIGGELHAPTYSSCGHMACESIGKLRADLAFFSTKALNLPTGTYEPLGPLLETRRALVNIADRVVLVADHTKFTARSLCLSIPMKDIDCVVTDQAAKPEWIEELRALGKEVIIA